MIQQQLSELDYKALLGLAAEDSLPTWAVPELVLTAPALERAKTPRPWPVRSEFDVFVSLNVVGDILFAELAARTLARRIPPPVVDYIIKRATVLTLGYPNLGFAGPQVRSEHRPWLITLLHRSDDEFAAVLAHEVAHAWLLPEPTETMVCGNAFWHFTIFDTPIDSVPADVRDVVMEHRFQSRDNEIAAVRLTRAWGFPDMGEMAGIP